MFHIFPTWFQQMWIWFLDLLFPRFCLGCQRENSFLCGSCLSQIPLQQEQVCPLCYKENGTGLVCVSCQKGDFYLDGLITASSFQKKSLLQQTIHAFKYDFLEDLSQPLGQLLASSWLYFSATAKSDFANLHRLIICPIPLHPKRYRFRGFNQADLLARTFLKSIPHSLFAESLDSSCAQSPKESGSARSRPLELKISSFLKRTHYQRPQMELTRAERLTNVESVFQVSPHAHLDDAEILLIDDVATTLSTLNNAAKALKKAGAKAVYGLVLARVY